MEKQNTNQKKNDLSLFDLLFILLITISLSEAFLLPGIVEQLQSGKITPMWAMAAVLFLFLEPYKQQVYVMAVIISTIWVVLAIYKSWVRKKGGEIVEKSK